MRRVIVIVSLLALFSLHILVLKKISSAWHALPQDEESTYVMPSAILRITALEFDGLAADFLFLKSLVFIGSTAERAGRSSVNKWEWKWCYNILNASTDLDPYFLDPYYVANANLTWGAGMVQEVNTLLEKGSRFRDWDAQLPFYRGFNYFYFLRKNKEAAQCLMEASRRPGANPLFASLAAKLAYRENNTENSILLLEEIIKTTEEGVLKKLYVTRLEALKSLFNLEKATAAYKERYGKSPVTLEDLIQKHVLSKLPTDPYGGKFYIDSHGAVRTTSEDKLLPHQR